MADSGYGKALGVLGALAAHPEELEADDAIQKALLVIQDCGEPDDESEGTGHALAFLTTCKLPRGACLRRAREARGRRQLVPKAVARKIHKFNTSQACRMGDRTFWR